jgi:HPt (histidine-containing phosphotransfer) domain-containing protein
MNVDWERINSFITDDDPEELAWLKDMIVSLIGNYEERLAELDAIAISKNNEDLTSLLHQMKGLVANFGLEAIRNITIEAEALSKENKFDESIAVTRKIRPVWVDTKKELANKFDLT